jgi:hypothetical protein
MSSESDVCFGNATSRDRRTAFGPVSDLLPPTGRGSATPFEGVINLDAVAADLTFQLGVPEQQLHGAEILRATIDQRGFSPPERVRSVARPVQSQLLDPGIHDPGVLPRRQMG